MAKTQAIVPAERIESRILLIRGHKVMLDADLADLYGVETRILVQAVKRNEERFPEDFMFQLSREEFGYLRSQSVTSSQWGGRRYPPYALTEQGVAMLSSVLRNLSGSRLPTGQAGERKEMMCRPDPTETRPRCGVLTTLRIGMTDCCDLRHYPRSKMSHYQAAGLELKPS